MYMLRAYQSPYSMEDWGPQWDQMPNLASVNQAGKREAWRDTRVPLKGPGVTSGLTSEAVWLNAAGRASAGAAAPRSLRALRRVRGIPTGLFVLLAIVLPLPGICVKVFEQKTLGLDFG